MDEIVLSSDWSAGETVGASTVSAGGVIGEPKTGMNSSFGPVIVSIRSTKHKRQDLTHQTIVIENANTSFKGKEAVSYTQQTQYSVQLLFSHQPSYTQKTPGVIHGLKS